MQLSLCLNSCCHDFTALWWTEPWDVSEMKNFNQKRKRRKGGRGGGNGREKDGRKDRIKEEEEKGQTGEGGGGRDSSCGGLGEIPLSCVLKASACLTVTPRRCCWFLIVGLCTLGGSLGSGLQLAEHRHWRYLPLSIWLRYIHQSSYTLISSWIK